MEIVNNGVNVTSTKKYGTLVYIGLLDDTTKGVIVAFVPVA
jgi:hypothetical protein